MDLICLIISIGIYLAQSILHRGKEVGQFVAEPDDSFDRWHVCGASHLQFPKILTVGQTRSNAPTWPSIGMEVNSCKLLSLPSTFPITSTKEPTLYTLAVVIPRTCAYRFREELFAITTQRTDAQGKRRTET